jgi:hypothetical protein
LLSKSFFEVSSVWHRLTRFPFRSIWNILVGWCLIDSHHAMITRRHRYSILTFNNVNRPLQLVSCYLHLLLFLIPSK